MARRSIPNSISGSRDGVALIIVLAFIVLTSILVISFIAFSSSNRLSTSSYARAIQAQEIAQGGLQDILSDLHREIIAGSMVDPNGMTYSQGSGVTNVVYVPWTNLTAQPARIGYASSSYGTDTTINTLSPTLVRVSRATGNPNAPGGDAFFTQIAGATGVYANNMDAVPGETILNRASMVSTATSSSNGRYISTTRWNKPYLLASTTANVPKPFANAPPDWIYVTRTGSRVCAGSELSSLKLSNNLATNYGTITPGANPPASPVVGRYAFVMYDEGALLDANVAGSDSNAIGGGISSSASPANPTYTTANPVPSYGYTNATGTPVGPNITFPGKSYSAMADLTALPGLTQANVDTFVNWRNAGGIANATSTAYPFLAAVYGYATNGFLAFQTSSGTASASDSPLVERQDLINYFAHIDSNMNTASATVSQALPYLGTFSRAVERPSWYPPLDSSSIPSYASGLGTAVLYHTNMEQAKVGGVSIANRDLANLRSANTASIVHYFDDPTAATPTGTYSVTAGEPMLQTRFSLAKIAWLSQSWAGQTDPGTTSSSYAGSVYPAAIQACFGLVWGSPGSKTTNSNRSSVTANGGNPCWNYVGSPVGAGGTAQTTALSGIIETLDQVALENREPNFFELLKAAILSGSIGLGPGKSVFNNGSNHSAVYGIGIYDFENNSGIMPTLFDMVGTPGLFSATFGPGSGVPVPATIPDMQIMQIGANIIDQFDSDSYPTAIYFPYLSSPAITASSATEFDPVLGNGSGIANALFGSVTMVYGDENLPVLNKIAEMVCSPDRTGSTNPPGAGDYNTTTMEGWLQPELWNPHQQPNVALASAPLNFQIRAYGGVYVYAWGLSGTSAAGKSEPSAPDVVSNGVTPGGEGSTTVFYPGVSSSEGPSSGSREQRGTLAFNVSSGGFPFYTTPRGLTTEQPMTGESSVTVNTSVGLPASTTTPTSFAGSNFPYYGMTTVSGKPTIGANLNPALGPYSNDFAGFSAGLISNWYVNPGPTGGTVGVDYGVTAGYPAPGVSFALGWTDSKSNFHPYSLISGIYIQSANRNQYPEAFLGCVGFWPGETNQVNWGVADPRTSRFSHMFNTGMNNINTTVMPYNGATGAGYTQVIPGYDATNDPSATITPKNFASLEYAPAYGPENKYPQGWVTNTSTGSSSLDTTYYADPDGVVRPADGAYINLNSGDGVMTFTSNGTPTGGTSYALGDNGGNAQHGRRPVILNRPFRSVGELGYVFRDLPCKTLDFFSASSADAALLDVFSVNDETRISAGSTTIDPMVSGEVALSNAPVPVIEALLSVGAKKEIDPTYYMLDTPLATSDVVKVANAIATQLSPNTANGGPLLNRAGLTSLGPIVHSAFSSSPDQGNKAYIEAPVRALSEVTSTRTWSLMIDIIAQAGQMSPAANSSDTNPLSEFVVEGEKRYWLHVAIDRYTGKIIDQQLEPVYE